MASWTYVEPTSPEDSTPVNVTMTEDEIISEYFEYWSGRMRRVNKEHLVSRERCIDDWVTMHWATLND